jgi:hypothetical protein
MAIQLFGAISDEVRAEIDAMTAGIVNTVVFRKDTARSRHSFPVSTDLEQAIRPWMECNGYAHHPKFLHPLTGKGFEYDFFNERLQIAVEVMGYRADDEVYKDILKFHVHKQTLFGVVLVPRWKWLGIKRTSTNFDAALKALSFANTFMNVSALISIAYDWEDDGNGWRLTLAG